MNERKEPQFDPDALGVLEQPRFPGERRARPSRPRRRRSFAWLIVVLLVPLAFALYYWREPIAAWVMPEPRQNRLIDEAAAALAAGRLSAADGRGARELYGAVLALDPDNPAARDGLARVGAAALQQGRAALEAGDLAAARDALALARTLSVPAAELQPLEAELQQRENTGVQLESLLGAARTAQAAGRIDEGEDSALALYARALAADPGNAVALAGRREALSALLRQAEAALAEGDLALAEQRVSRVAQIDPQHFELPPLRARLTELERQREQGRQERLIAGERALAAGRLDEARAAFEAVLQTAPDTARARIGLDKIALAYAAQAERLAADFDFEGAQARLAEARALAPESAAVRAAEQRLGRAQQSRTRLGVADSGAHADQLERLLTEARRAEEVGNLLDPPGDSAWDKLRAAAALAPDEPRVRAAQARFASAAGDCYERELAGNRLSQAGACLDAVVAANPSDPRLPDLRRRLAGRWLGVAAERLGAGELGAAQRAVTAAAELDPRHPQLVALQARLEQAQAAAPRR